MSEPLLTDGMSGQERRAAVLAVLRRFLCTGPFDPHLDEALEWTIKVLSEGSFDPGDHRCHLCGEECRHAYAVKDEVWRAVMPSRRGHLHLGCLETALGRVLTADEFKDAPINAGILYFLRLGGRR